MSHTTYLLTTLKNSTKLHQWSEYLALIKIKTFVDMTYEQFNKISSSSSGKLYFYSNILNPTDYKLQDYLKFPFKKSLFMETGWYCKPVEPIEKHFRCNCKLLVEKEKHSVLYCPVYDNLRFQYCDILAINYIVVLILSKILSSHVIFIL
jgi:hypothetical protein